MTPTGQIVWEMLLPVFTEPRYADPIVPLMLFPALAEGNAPARIREAFPLLRLGLARPRPPNFDLDSVENRSAELEMSDVAEIRS